MGYAVRTNQAVVVEFFPSFPLLPKFLRDSTIQARNPILEMSGGNSVVEFLPSKQAVAGSNPVPRSSITSLMKTRAPHGGERCCCKSVV